MRNRRPANRRNRALTSVLRVRARSIGDVVKLGPQIRCRRGLRRVERALDVPPSGCRRLSQHESAGLIVSDAFAAEGSQHQKERAWRPARMPSARRLPLQPTESLAASCPVSVVPLASVSALAAFGSFPCLSYHPCLPSAGSLLAIMARDGEWVANTGLPWRHDDPPFKERRPHIWAYARCAVTSFDDDLRACRPVR